jgi:WD40 repeat protein
LDGRTVVTAACDAAVRIWSVMDGGWEEDQVFTFDGAGECVSDVHLLKHDTILVTVNHTHVFRLIRDEHLWRKEEVQLRSIPGYLIRCIRTLDEDDMVVAWINRSKKSSIIVVDGVKLTLPHVITSLSVKRSLFAVGCSDGTVLVYELPSDKFTLRAKYEHSFAVTSTGIVDNIVVSGSADGSVKVCPVYIRERRIDGVTILLISLLLAQLSYLIKTYNNQLSLL